MSLSLHPKISVIMPVYNCQLFVKEAVESILVQTFTDFEFLIIDDCSTDQTREIIDSYSDRRIQFIKKPKNTGYTDSLNFALKMAKGKYIARMDGDDVSLPNRFEKQVEFLENNTDIVVCGSWFLDIKTKNIFKYPEFSNDICISLIRKNVIVHPVVMIRRNVLTDNNLFYDKDFEPAEDYHLWCRLLDFGKLHNLQEPLIEYRFHDNQISRTQSQKQINNSTNIQLFLLEKFKIELNENEVLARLLLVKNQIPKTFNDVLAYFSLLKKYKIANKKSNVFDAKKFTLFLKNEKQSVFCNYFFKQKSFDLLLLKDYFKVQIEYFNFYKFTLHFKFFIKCIFHFKTQTI
jgi:glycosyltransferase involved in cell wall biosynthesis